MGLWFQRVRVRDSGTRAWGRNTESLRVHTLIHKKEGERHKLAKERREERAKYLGECLGSVIIFIDIPQPPVNKYYRPF